MPATSRLRAASRAGSPSAAARSRTGRRSSCAPGRSREELAALAAEGVQSLLLEGGPTLAGAFLEADLVDKMLVFVAPLLAGATGRRILPRLGSVRALSHLSARLVGEDVLLEAYVHPP